MFGNYEGSPQEKLEQVEGLFSTLSPQAACRLSADDLKIVCQALRVDGEMHVESLSVELLPAEVVRQAAMRLGKATHPPESIGDWERWASAWHLIQVHAIGALAYADEQVAIPRADGSLSGVVLWEDLRRRVAVLRAEPQAWAGRA